MDSLLDLNHIADLFKEDRIEQRSRPVKRAAAPEVKASFHIRTWSFFGSSPKSEKRDKYMILM